MFVCGFKIVVLSFFCLIKKKKQKTPRSSIADNQVCVIEVNFVAAFGGAFVKTTAFHCVAPMFVILYIAVKKWEE